MKSFVFTGRCTQKFETDISPMSSDFWAPKLRNCRPVTMWVTPNLFLSFIPWIYLIVMVLVYNCGRNQWSLPVRFWTTPFQTSFRWCEPWIRFFSLSKTQFKSFCAFPPFRPCLFSLLWPKPKHCQQNVIKHEQTIVSETEFILQKRHNLASVSDMKNFVANDLKGLKQQHKSLTVRKYLVYALFAPDFENHRTSHANSMKLALTSATQNHHCQSLAWSECHWRESDGASLVLCDVP